MTVNEAVSILRAAIADKVHRLFLVCEDETLREINLLWTKVCLYELGRIGRFLLKGSIENPFGREPSPNVPLCCNCGQELPCEPQPVSEPTP